MYDNYEEVPFGKHRYRVYGAYANKTEVAACGRCGSRELMTFLFLEKAKEIINEESTVKLPVDCPRSKSILKALRQQMLAEIRCSKCEKEEEILNGSD